LDRPDHENLEAGPPPRHGPTPLGLDYFAHDETSRSSRAVNLAIALVLLSLVPFACGVVNTLVAAQSYSATVTGSHRGGAALFLAAGVVACVVGLVSLVRLRHASGIVLAVLVLAGELAVVVCIGIATVGR
jgi:hypothetical protein